MDVYIYLYQQAIGYAADVACVCTFFICGWMGQVGMCMARGKSARSLFDFILFYYIFIDSNIPHKRLFALNFSVKDNSFTRERKLS